MATVLPPLWLLHTAQRLPTYLAVALAVLALTACNLRDKGDDNGEPGPPPPLPYPVTALTADTSVAGQVTLTWTNPASADFAGVVVRRSTTAFPLTQSDGDEIYRGTAETYVDGGLAPAVYYYSVFAFDAADRYAVPALAGALLADTTGPGPVTGVTVDDSVDRELTLSWTNPTDPDFAEVVVLRSTTDYPLVPADGDEVYRGTAETYADSGLAVGDYYYALYAYDTSGLRSYPAVASGTAQDRTAPVLVSRTPAVDAVDVALDTAITVTFNEALGGGSIAVYDAYFYPVSGFTSYDSTTFTLTFVPYYALDYGTQYSVYVSNVTDLSGNGAAAFNWSFTTIADTQPPQVTSVSPAADATGVSIGTTIQVTFDEAVQPVTTWADAISIPGVTGTAGYNANARRLTFTPDAPLAYDTTYTATVDGVQDLAGNPLAAYSWSFTTEADVVPPEISARAPVNGQGLVSVEAAVTVTFSEAMDPVTLDSSTFSVTGVSGAVTYDDATYTATFTPTAPLDPDTGYTVSLDGTQITDAQGLALGTTAPWSFHTAGAPARLSGTTAPYPVFHGAAFNDAGQGLALARVDSGSGGKLVYYWYDGSAWSAETTIASYSWSEVNACRSYLDTRVLSNGTSFLVLRCDAQGRPTAEIFDGSGWRDTIVLNSSQPTASGLYKLASAGSAYLVYSRQGGSTAWVNQGAGWQQSTVAPAGYGSVTFANAVAADPGGAYPFLVAFTMSDYSVSQKHVVVAAFDGSGWSYDAVYTGDYPFHELTHVVMSSDGAGFLLAFADRVTNLAREYAVLRMVHGSPGAWSAPAVVVNDTDINVLAVRTASNGNGYMTGWVADIYDAGTGTTTRAFVTLPVSSAGVAGSASTRFSTGGYLGYFRPEDMRLATDGAGYLATWNELNGPLYADVYSGSAWSGATSFPDVNYYRVAAGGGRYHLLTEGYVGATKEIRSEVHNSAGWMTSHLHATDVEGGMDALVASPGGNHVLWRDDATLYGEIVVVGSTGYTPSGSFTFALAAYSGGVLGSPVASVNASHGVAVWSQYDGVARSYLRIAATRSGGVWGAPSELTDVANVPAILWTGSEYLLVWHDRAEVWEKRYDPASGLWSSASLVYDFTAPGVSIYLDPVQVAGNDAGGAAIVATFYDYAGSSKMYAIESDDGVTWKVPQLLYDTYGFDEFALAGNGAGYLVMFEAWSFSTNPHYLYAVLHDGTSWQTAALASTNPPAGGLSLASNGTGYGAVWVSSSDGARGRVHDGTGWSSYETGLGAASGNAAVASDGAGYLGLWHTATGTTLRTYSAGSWAPAVSTGAGLGAPVWDGAGGYYALSALADGAGDSLGSAYVTGGEVHDGQGFLEDSADRVLGPPLLLRHGTEATGLWLQDNEGSPEVWSATSGLP